MEKWLTNEYRETSKDNDDLHVVFQLSNLMIYPVYIGPEVYTLNFMINKVFLELETQQIPFQQVPLLLIQLDEGAAIFGQRHLRRSHVDTFGLENNFPDLQHAAIFKPSNIKYENLALQHKRVEEELNQNRSTFLRTILLLVFLNFHPTSVDSNEHTNHSRFIPQMWINVNIVILTRSIRDGKNLLSWWLNFFEILSFS